MTILPKQSCPVMRPGAGSHPVVNQQSIQDVLLPIYWVLPNGFAPITPDSSTLLFRPAGVADIPAANGSLTHCADAIRCNALTSSPGSALPYGHPSAA